MEKMAAVLFSMLLVTGGAGSVKGTWKTIDDRTGKVIAEVQLYQQGTKLFGRIAALTEPDDRHGKPRTCSRCTGDDKDKPIVGLVIIKDLSADGERFTGGTITDTADGTVYQAEVWPEDGKLKVRGYAGLFDRTHTWVKAQ